MIFLNDIVLTVQTRTIMQLFFSSPYLGPLSLSSRMYTLFSPLSTSLLHYPSIIYILKLRRIIVMQTYVYTVRCGPPPKYLHDPRAIRGAGAI
jgi:hypothetical protein